MNIIIFGPQGSGKGTQAELIARRHGLPYISTGDIFRYHIKNQTELGAKVSAFISNGELVPNELTNEIVRDRLQHPDCVKGFVLDGYPRNQAQMSFLLSKYEVNFAFVIELADDEAIKRLSERLACKCGLSYHVKHNPPKTPGVCNACGSELFRRDDDKPDVIKQRLAIYHSETEPLFGEFERRGILYRVDGSGDIENVFGQIDTILSNK